ncbi:MAG: T9SS type A sorting domain-containing protein [Bacteroidota bacterium]
MHQANVALTFIVFFLLICGISHAQTTYYVSVTGNNNTGIGTSLNPWATITHALDNASDGSTIIVTPGTYNGRVRMRGTFPQGVLVKSEVPYMAKLRNDDRVMTFYTHPNGCNGITIEGFDIAHDGPGADPLVVHIDGNGIGAVHDVTIRNCILHDSYDNDILKINNSCYNITIQGNLFFNQTGSDEHIDGNSMRNLVIEDNIFMNDFAASGRVNQNNTSSYIVIKDSGTSDMYTGAQDITIRRNVFLNYEGSTGHNFVLLGEDGMPYYEAFDVLIENNLMLGNSGNTMRAPLGIKGCKHATFRNNTVHGNFPSLAFAFRFNTEGSNLPNDSIFLYNNIWSDPTGTMNDFSDSPFGETDHFVMSNNVYWNGGLTIPSDISNDMINVDDDVNAIMGNPFLANHGGLVTPHFNSTTSQFADGSSTIREAFETLVLAYALMGFQSVALNTADQTNAPHDDILGNLRGGQTDVGCYEHETATSLAAPFQNFGVVLSPNPAKENVQLNINSDWMGVISISLYTTQGKLMRQSQGDKTSPKSIFQISLNGLSPGVYSVLLSSGAQRLWSGQLIKK